MITNLGGTRISLGPEQDMVDVNLKIWGLANVFVYSLSFFPTASHSNPMPTIMGLPHRLVDHLTNPENKRVSLSTINNAVFPRKDQPQF